MAVRIGFEENRTLGERETGGRTPLPILREIMSRIYRDQLVGRAPRFPCKIEEGIDEYLAAQALAEAEPDGPPTLAASSTMSPRP